MWLERISGGGVDLVDLVAAKAHLRLLESDFDAEVQGAISAASAYLDVDSDGFGGLGFPLVSQQWAQKGASFNPQVLRLPFPRIVSVDEIRFTAADGNVGTVATTNYRLVKSGRDWRIVLRSGGVWPDLSDQPDAVEVRFTAGFADVASVPTDIVEAAKQLIGFYFHNRGAEAHGGVSEEVARCVGRLTARYRRFAA